MDIVLAANQAVGLLIPFLPYLQEAGKAIAKEIAGDSWEKAKSLFHSVKQYLAKNPNEQAQSLLTMFEKDPELYKEALVKVFVRLAETDTEFAAILKGAVESSTRPASIVQTAVGSGIAIASGTGASASVTMADDKPANKKKTKRSK